MAYQYKKTLIFALFSILLLGCSQVHTKDVKSHTTASASKDNYPPYPDVWGYDLAKFPAVKEYGLSGSVYRMKSGDIYFIFPETYNQYGNNDKTLNLKAKNFVLLKFFAQETEILTPDEFNKFDKKYRNNKISLEERKKVIFKDQTSLSMKYAHVAKHCSQDPLENYIIKQDSRGFKIQTTSLLYALEKPKVIDSGYCDVDDDLTEITQYVDHYNITFIDLHDDTFIAFDAGTQANMLVRFKKDFSTPFPLIGKRLFVVDHEKLLEIKQQYIRSKQYRQNYQNAVLNYLKTLTAQNKQGDS